MPAVKLTSTWKSKVSIIKSEFILTLDSCLVATMPIAVLGWIRWAHRIRLEIVAYRARREMVRPLNWSVCNMLACASCRNWLPKKPFRTIQSSVRAKMERKPCGRLPNGPTWLLPISNVNSMCQKTAQINWWINEEFTKIRWERRSSGQVGDRRRIWFQNSGIFF